jgi:hypothetical protein
MNGCGGLLQGVSYEIMQDEVVDMLEQVVEILTDETGAFSLS